MSDIGVYFGDNYFRITEQSSRAYKIFSSEVTERFFFEGYCICSCNRPALGSRTIWIRGIDKNKDDDAISVSPYKIPKIAKAIADNCKHEGLLYSFTGAIKETLDRIEL